MLKQADHVADLFEPTTTAPPLRGDPQAPEPAPDSEDVAALLAQMSFAERVRAYRSGAFSRRELAVAAARDPDSMPLLNGEYEWISVWLADLD